MTLTSHFLLIPQPGECLPVYARARVCLCLGMLFTSLGSWFFLSFCDLFPNKGFQALLHLLQLFSPVFDSPFSSSCTYFDEWRSLTFSCLFLSSWRLPVWLCDCCLSQFAFGFFFTCFYFLRQSLRSLGLTLNSLWSRCWPWTPDLLLLLPKC